MTTPISRPLTIDTLLGIQPTEGEKNAGNDSTVTLRNGSGRSQPRNRRRTLVEILAEADRHANWQALLDQALPVRLRGLARLIDTANGILLVECDNAATATLLRLQQHTILANLKRGGDFPELNMLKPKIRPGEHRLHRKTGFRLPDSDTIEWLAQSELAAGASEDIVDSALADLTATLRRAAKKQRRG